MARRHEISNDQWDRIKDRLPDKPADVGRTARGNRLIVNAVPRVLRSGAPRADLLERYGKHKPVHKHCSCWCEKGV